MAGYPLTFIWNSNVAVQVLCVLFKYAEIEVVIRYPLNIDVRDLDVLVVDDVNDSGDTLAAVNHLAALRFDQVKVRIPRNRPP